MANYVEIEAGQCKGCWLCIECCPTQSLAQGTELNKSGYQYARFEQHGCTACGFCYYMCPEPGAITVIKDDAKAVANG
jgi:formate hydrogenlyase subunit 6/NADH:ubiquinone oxidoreductase subunit I